MTAIFTNLLEQLNDFDNQFDLNRLVLFSDLDKKKSAHFKSSWENLSSTTKCTVLKELGDLEVLQFELDFQQVNRIALQDSDPKVLKCVLDNLNDHKVPDLIPSFISLLNNTAHTDLKVSTARVLGQYVYLGELAELEETLLIQIVTQLLSLFDTNESKEVCNQALISLGYSDNSKVRELIRHYLSSSNLGEVGAALNAISRSANESWEADVLGFFDSTHPSLRLQAARAAGGLEIPAAIPGLVELLTDVDSEICLAAIWSLGQIGGKAAAGILAQLYEKSEDPEEVDMIEDALGLAEFIGGASNAMFDEYDLDDIYAPETDFD